MEGHIHANGDHDQRYPAFTEKRERHDRAFDETHERIQDQKCWNIGQPFAHDHVIKQKQE